MGSVDGHGDPKARHERVPAAPFGAQSNDGTALPNRAGCGSNCDVLGWYCCRTKSHLKSVRNSKTGFYTPPPLEGKIATDTFTPSPAPVVYKISGRMEGGFSYTTGAEAENSAVKFSKESVPPFYKNRSSRKATLSREIDKPSFVVCDFLVAPAHAQIEGSSPTIVCRHGHASDSIFKVRIEDHNQWRDLKRGFQPQIAEIDQESKRTHKPKNHTNSTNDFSAHFEGVTSHFPVKQGLLRQIAPESALGYSATSLSHSFIVVPFLSPIRSDSNFPLQTLGETQAPIFQGFQFSFACSLHLDCG